MRLTTAIGFVVGSFRAPSPGARGSRTNEGAGMIPSPFAFSSGRAVLYQSSFMPNRAMVGGTMALGNRNVALLAQLMFCSAFEFVML